MAFTTSCFIRKNTPELLAKLEQIGYVRALHEEDYNTIGLSVDQGDIFPLRTDDIPILTKESFIDCGENEELFLALVALRDDKPDYQWFVWDDNYVDNRFKQYIPGEPWEEWWWFEVHKATIEELIEHFK